MHQEDPTIIIEYSKELKQIILSGQGEYHLNILKWHLDNIYKIETEFWAPKIPYRETITKLPRLITGIRNNQADQVSLVRFI